ncbi:MAG: hypothetical protein WC365_08035 [Candidatus Babeliales bacterium]|jgi:hypothetical protein
MIYEQIKDKNGNCIAARNIFNATLAELLMSARKCKKEIEKIDRRGRFGFTIYYISGKETTYQVYYH